MHANHLLLEEPIRMASILEPSKPVSINTDTVWFWFFSLVFLLCTVAITRKSQKKKFHFRQPDFVWTDYDKIESFISRCLLNSLGTIDIAVFPDWSGWWVLVLIGSMSSLDVSSFMFRNWTMLCADFLSGDDEDCWNPWSEIKICPDYFGLSEGGNVRYCPPPPVALVEMFNELYSCLNILWYSFDCVVLPPLSFSGVWYGRIFLCQIYITSVHFSSTEISGEVWLFMGWHWISPRDSGKLEVSS